MTDTPELKKTALHPRHLALGGRMVEFGGWSMPVQYSSIRDEHIAVRNHGGLFDISHMGEFLVKGKEACHFLNSLLTNNVARIKPGEGQYTLMCNEDGGVLDDLYLYCLDPSLYLLIVNASRLEADWQWVTSQMKKCSLSPSDLDGENRSGSLSAVAVQGPKVRDWINHCFSTPASNSTIEAVSDLKKNQIASFVVQKEVVWIGATGYTGEDGFEIIASNEIIPEIWDTLLAEGHQGCLQPAGLGARDTLRTEMCYPLYGHELNEHTTPLEAGLGFFVDFDKGNFAGRKALHQQKANGIQHRSVAFKMTTKSAPPRPDYQVLTPENDVIGRVTSGTSSPSLNQGIGLARIQVEHAKVGKTIQIEIRGRTFPAEIVKKPIYRKS